MGIKNMGLLLVKKGFSDYGACEIIIGVGCGDKKVDCAGTPMILDLDN